MLHVTVSMRLDGRAALLGLLLLSCPGETGLGVAKCVLCCSVL